MVIPTVNTNGYLPAYRSSRSSSQDITSNSIDRIPIKEKKTLSILPRPNALVPVSMPWVKVDYIHKPSEPSSAPKIESSGLSNIIEHIEQSDSDIRNLAIQARRYQHTKAEHCRRQDLQEKFRILHKELVQQHSSRKLTKLEIVREATKYIEEMQKKMSIQANSSNNVGGPHIQLYDRNEAMEPATNAYNEFLSSTMMLPSITDPPAMQKLWDSQDLILSYQPFIEENPFQIF
jgi:hypothetical protein